MRVPINATLDVQKSIQEIHDFLRGLERRIPSAPTGSVERDVSELQGKVGRLERNPLPLDFNDVFRASGGAHAFGYVPDPGATAGVDRFLREDATWAAPGYVGAMVNNSTDITINTGASTVLTFDTEVWDTRGFHSNAGDTSRLTVPAGLGGYYRVTGRVRWKNEVAPTDWRVLRIEKGSAGTPTGANILGMTGVQAVVTASTSTDQEVTVTALLAAGEYIEMFAGTGQNTTVLFANFGYDVPFLEMHRVGV